MSIQTVADLLAGALGIAEATTRLAEAGYVYRVADYRITVTVDGSSVFAQLISETIGPLGVSRARWVIYSHNDLRRLTVSAHRGHH